MKKNEIGLACGVCGEERRGAYKVFGGETLGNETTGKT
jgi:hypothetical protein